MFIAEKVLDWSNAPLVARCNKYLAEINSLDTQLNHIITELETSIIAKMISRKNYLRRTDSMIISTNTKSEVETIEEKPFKVFGGWYNI